MWGRASREGRWGQLESILPISPKYAASHSQSHYGKGRWCRSTKDHSGLQRGGRWLRRQRAGCFRSRRRSGCRCCSQTWVTSTRHSTLNRQGVIAGEWTLGILESCWPTSGVGNRPRSPRRLTWKHWSPS